MPYADVEVNVQLTTNTKGFDIFDIRARNLAPNRDYTVFLLEQAGTPFGAAESAAVAQRSFETTLWPVLTVKHTR